MNPQDQDVILDEPPLMAMAPVEATAWLEERLAEVAGYDKKTASQCMEALLETSDLDNAELEILESVWFLACGHPRLAEKHRVEPHELGRRLAQHLEHETHPERAIAVLERVASDCPDSRVIERELAGVMRRAGLVQELVDRYLGRARVLLKSGRPLEAVPWLQEVLLVDRSRRDVARMIRDLRYQDVESATRSKQRTRLAALAFVLVGLGTLVTLREKSLYERFDLLHFDAFETLEDARAHLAELEAFAAAHPVWTGVLTVRSEVARAQSAVRHFEERRVASAAQARKEQMEAQLAADHALALGTARADAGDMEDALQHLEQALELGGADWAERRQTERDVVAIRKWLEGSE